jgi:hypothetical protein
MSPRSNRLKEQHKCNLGGSGEPTLRRGLTCGPLEVGQPIGRVGQPHLAASWASPWCGVLWCLLESSGVHFAVDKRD